MRVFVCVCVCGSMQYFAFVYIRCCVPAVSALCVCVCVSVQWFVYTWCQSVGNIYGFFVCMCCVYVVIVLGNHRKLESLFLCVVVNMINFKNCYIRPVLGKCTT